MAHTKVWRGVESRGEGGGNGRGKEWENKKRRNGESGAKGTPYRKEKRHDWAKIVGDKMMRGKRGASTRELHGAASVLTGGGERGRVQSGGGHTEVT